MNVVAIIPARGGSKRIPRKNIKLFDGHPIISYSIRIALESGLFSDVMVSTDDEEIAEIAKHYGAKVPFRRSAKNSDDTATTADVLIEVLETYQANDQYFEFACCIYPTAPLVTVSSLKEGFTRMTNESFDVVIPILRYGYPIQRALKRIDARISMAFPENKDTPSQELQPMFHDSGQFYWLNVQRFLQKKQLWTDNVGSIEVSALDAQDIDTMEDWRLAEIKYMMRQ